MLKQYSILNCCLSELKKSGIPAMEKLKLEVELIRMKRILLDHEVEHRVRGDIAGETEFNLLYSLMQDACSSDNETERIVKVVMHLQKTRDSLKKGHKLLSDTNKNKNRRFSFQNIFDILSI
jgi:hypothetical protein